MSDIRMVRVIDKRVSNSNANAMYRYLVGIIAPKHRQWLEPLKAYGVLLFLPTIIQMERIEPDLLKDTATTCYLPFDNGIISINRFGVKLNPYNEILVGKTCILNEKIIHKTVDLNCGDFKQGAWYQFCEKAVGAEGLSYLMRTLGYMIHTYKDKSNAKMIMFADSDHLDNPNAMGGTGKSLIAFDSLKELRLTHWEDGKNFNSKDKFKFQGVKAEHDIVCIDDIPKNFNQDVLYNMVTGNFSSEEKYKARVTLNFQDSCKFIITGNFGFVLSGDSDKRRSIVIGFTNHFNKQNTPMEEFKYRFFDEWVDERAIEYQYFYEFMFECVKQYLLHGIESYRYDEIVQKGVASAFSQSLLAAIHAVKAQFIGIKNAMRMMDWQTIVGTKEPETLEVLRKVMDSEGYIIKTTRKHGTSTLYYFEKK